MAASRDPVRARRLLKYGFPVLRVAATWQKKRIPCYTAFIIFSQSLKSSTRVTPTAGGCVVEEETLAYQTLEARRHMDVFASKSAQKQSEKTYAPAFRVATWLWERFQCQHTEMSRPITRDGETYRACVKCGARRPFNLNAWTMKGGYYFKPNAVDPTLGEKKVAARTVPRGEIKTAA